MIPFVDLDAGIGFAEQDVGDTQLLAQAIIVQAAQLQILYLEQALVVGSIQHVEPGDLESTAYLQLADGPWRSVTRSSLVRLASSPSRTLMRSRSCR